MWFCYKLISSVQGTFFQRKKRGKDGTIGKKLSDHKLNRRSDAEWMHLKRLDEGKSLIRQLSKTVRLFAVFSRYPLSKS